MVILGLGSNVGDRFAHLQKALEKIKLIPNLIIKQVSPLYVSDALLPENAPSTWNMPFINCAIRCETVLTPEELLNAIKQIEIQLGRPLQKAEWSPRNIDIDILAWDDLTQYDNQLHIPHEYLHERPFAFWPLADIAPFWVYPIAGSLQGKTAVELASQWGSRFTGEAPFHTKQIHQRIDTSELVGILNLTPDSFSSDGAFYKPKAAIEQLVSLVDAGATIIDIGAEATGPNATPITAAEEWLRLEPVLLALCEIKNNLAFMPKISIDTYHPETVKKASAFNIDWINDVSGGMNSAMLDVLTDDHAGDIVIMHHLGVPVNSQTLAARQDAVFIVYQWAEKQLGILQNLGINHERIIIDVGIGYGKTAEQSLALIKNCRLFHNLGTRLLIGHSRKSFLKSFTDNPPNERDHETLALSLYLNEQKIDYLRVHNVAAHAKAFKVAAAVQT
jgi:2-amino-4-hydroxy-6-hydroxymethyldihydropteridine diphosphokinase/dihydropteroate synthase